MSAGSLASLLVRCACRLLRFAFFCALPRLRAFGFLAALLITTAALPDRTQFAEPAQVHVVATRRPRRRRVRSDGLWLRVAAMGCWWPVRLYGDLQRTLLVGAASLMARSGLCPVAIVGSVLLCRHLMWAAAVGLGSGRLLAWGRAVERVTRAAVSSTLFVLLVATFAQWHQGPELGGTAALIATCCSQRGSQQVGASVRVRDGRARVDICGVAVLELPVDTEQDERLAMVMCRKLRYPDGRPMLTHQQIADAFGKNSRQDCHNRMQKLARAGGSPAQMVLNGRRGRLSVIHPHVLEIIARHWERDPLATAEQTHRWLTSQSMPAGVPLPTLEQVRSIKSLDGNLVAIRSAIRRQLERSGGVTTVRPASFVARLLEVVDDQARQIDQAGIQPAPVPAVVEAARLGQADPPARFSQAGRALLDALRALVRPATADEQERLAGEVGSDNVTPLHYGVLYCVLRLSIGQVAALVGRSKSVVYRGLRRLHQILAQLDPWPPAARFSGVLAIDEKWVRIPKSFSEDERHNGKCWRYVHFAVDALTGDLLHVEVFESSDGESVRAFLAAVRAKGIRPRAVVTDMLAAYGNAIRDTFGPAVVHHYCLFHHLQAIRHRLREKCGKDWNKQPLLRRLVEQIDNIYKCRDRRTAKRRLKKVLALRDQIERDHPEAVAVLDTVEQRFPLVANAIGRKRLPVTNNVVERTIKAFNRHYKLMAGFESLDTARIQVRLFAFFYRLTPMREPARKEDRGVCPLQRAGWDLRGVPVADYVRRFVLAWDDDGPDLFAVAPQPATSDRTPERQADQALAAAA
jgi:transposase-like protein